MIYFNGKIYGEEGRFHDAMKIEGQSIDAIGGNDEILSLKGDDEETYDLNGSLVLPGFNDSHIHLLNYGFSCQMFTMYHLTSINQMIQEGIDFLRNNDLYQDTWLLGRGWNQDYFEEGIYPTAKDLDEISDELPIYFSRTCGHMGVMNTKAMVMLKEMGFDHEHMDWKTGHVFEEAILGVFSKLPAPEGDAIKSMILRAQEDLFKCGITSVQSDDLASLPQSKPQMIIEAFEELKKEGLLDISIYQQCLLPTMDDLENFESLNFRTGDGDEYFKIGPLKLLIDGSLGARTAYLNEPYEGTEEVGIALYTQEELNAMMEKAKAMGMQIACHGIGDGAMDLILDAYDSIDASRDDRHGIIHCQITNNKTFDRMAKRGIVGYIQPIFIDYDMHIVEARVGSKREKETYNWKSLLKNDIPVAGGSDAPVVGFDVFENLYSAVTRRDLKGNPEEGWLPDQKFSRQEAIDLFTSGSAYASFDENNKGILKKGMQADFVLVDQDYFTVAEEEIKNLKVTMTVVKGKIVYKKDQ